jgi:predicted protein tyrosine phosphatase
MKHLLFVCSRNRRRSPTAEQIFAHRDDVEVSSAGTSPDADNPVTADLVDWADVIFVMERVHAQRLRRRFAHQLRNARVISLDIPDNFHFMDDELVRILKARMARHLPS